MSKTVIGKARVVNIGGGGGGGGMDGSTVVLIALIVLGVLFGAAIVAAVVAFIHLVLEILTIIGALTVAAGAVYARVRYARRGNQPAARLACGHLATRIAVVTGNCSPCQAVQAVSSRRSAGPAAGEIEPPREIHNHQHILISDPDTAAAVLKAMQEQAGGSR
jgi:hypothetical protein